MSVCHLPSLATSHSNVHRNVWPELHSTVGCGSRDFFHTEKLWITAGVVFLEASLTCRCCSPARPAPLEGGYTATSCKRALIPLCWRQWEQILHPAGTYSVLQNTVGQVVRTLHTVVLICLNCYSQMEATGPSNRNLQTHKQLYYPYHNDIQQNVTHLHVSTWMCCTWNCCILVLLCSFFFFFFAPKNLYFKDCFAIWWKQPVRSSAKIFPALL